MRVLIIDDDEFSAEINRLWCEEQVDIVAKVRVMKNSTQYKNALRLYHPHIVLLDLKMPNVNGMTILKYIKDNYADIVVIVNSASVMPEDISAVMNEGADEFLWKPYKPPELIEMLNKWYPIVKKIESERREEMENIFHKQ